MAGVLTGILASKKLNLEMPIERRAPKFRFPAHEMERPKRGLAVIKQLGMESEWQELIDGCRTKGEAPEALAD